MSPSRAVTVHTLLAGPSALAGLPDEARAALEHCLYPVRFAAGEAIIRQGNTDKDLYLLSRGEAQATMTNRAGQQVEIGRLSPGDVFGEWSLLTHRPRAASVTASTDVDAHILHQEDYEIVLDSFPSLVQYVRRALSIRQREYAGILAAELNRWASSNGGMRKDQILTVSFLTVAAVPSAPLAALLSTARFCLWSTSLETLAGEAGKDRTELDEAANEILAVVRDQGGGGTGSGLGPVLASIEENLSRYPFFARWRQSWLGQIEKALYSPAQESSSEVARTRSGMDQQLALAYLATLHMVFDPASIVDYVEQLQALDRQAAQAVGTAYQLHLTVSQIRREHQRPGHRRPDAGARDGRRAVEKQLSELDRRARGLPRPARRSTSAILTLTRLLSEYFLRLDELHPRMVALPRGVE